jgi:predicted regulator of Ras-like GTPase activity (Roadblock/LC7/MglB family)
MIDLSDIEERIAKCNKILDENPSSQIFAALAEAYRKKGELDQAFRVCQTGLKVHPNYGSAHLVMAKINLDKGMYDWAETEVQKAVELDGATRATELLLSEIYIYKGDFNKACRMLEALHQADPNNEQITRLLEIARKIPLDKERGDPLDISDTPIPESSQPQPAPPPPPPPDSEPEAPAPSPDSQLPDLDYKQMFKSLVGTPGIDGVLLLNKDGLAIEAVWNIPGDTDLVGALAVEAARHTTNQMRDLGFGNLESMMIETPDSLLYLAGAKGKLLAVVCTETVNLGSLKMKLASLMPRLAG